MGRANARTVGVIRGARIERYVLACYRTIELNPHRAGMASHPRQYRWSSYRINVEGKASNLIEPPARFL